MFTASSLCIMRAMRHRIVKRVDCVILGASSTAMRWKSRLCECCVRTILPLFLVLSMNVAAAIEPTALYVISGKEAGEVVMSWPAAGGEGMPVGVTENERDPSGGNSRRVSADAPGRFLYAGGQRVALGYQSLELVKCLNRKSTVTWTNLWEQAWAKSTENGGVTVEFYINVAPGLSVNDEAQFLIGDGADVSTEPKLHVSFVADREIRLKNMSQGIKSSLFVSYEPDDEMLNNRWWHIAVLISRSEGKAKLYVDRHYVTQVDWANTACTPGRIISFSSGTGSPQARIAAFRVTPDLLTADEMLIASDWDSAAAAPEGTQTLALYSLCAEVSGDRAATNDVSPDSGAVWDYRLQVRKCGPCATGLEQAVFTNAAPGRYVYSGRCGALVAERPNSLFLASMTMNTGARAGWALDLSSVAHGLHALDSWTLEWFYRLERPVNKGVTMQIASLQGDQSFLIDMGMGNSGNNNDIRVYALNVTSGTAASRNPELRSYVERPDNRDDGASRWHHAALTYSRETGELETWIDYARLQPSAEQAAIGFEFGHVAGIPDDLDAVRLYIGNSNICLTAEEATAKTMRGSVSCIRVSSGILDASDFLVATDVPRTIPDDPTLFHWRFDGPVGQSVSNEIPYSYVGELFTGYPFRYMEAEYGTNVYAADVRSPKMSIAGNMLEGNTGSLYCRNSGRTGIGTQARLYQLAKYDAPTYGSILHPATFTMEAYVKSEAGASGEMRLMGSAVGNANGTLSWLWAVTCDGATGAVRVKFNGGNHVLRSAGSDVLGSLADHRWHHVALAFDRDSRSARFYFDHRLSAETSGDDAILFEDSPYSYFIVGNSFSGWIDEVRLSNRMLLPDEMVNRVPFGLTVVIR